MSNSLDPDQARHFVGPDLGANCLQRLSADDTSRQRVNTLGRVHGSRRGLDKPKKTKNNENSQVNVLRNISTCTHQHISCGY